MTTLLDICSELASGGSKGLNEDRISTFRDSASSRGVSASIDASVRRGRGFCEFF